MRRNRRARGPRRSRRVNRPKTVEQSSGVKQSGIVRNGMRRYPGPITVPLAQTIMIQMSGLSTLTTSGAGIIAGTLPCDPTTTLAAPFTAGAMFSQFSSWANVFTSIKCVQLDVTIIPLTVDEVKGDVNVPLAIAGSIQVATAPAGYSDLINNSDSQTYPLLLDTRGTGRYHSVRHKGDLLYATTAIPVPSASLYAGCPGGIGFYGGTFPISTAIANLRYTGTYRVRMWT